MSRPDRLISCVGRRTHGPEVDDDVSGKAEAEEQGLRRTCDGHAHILVATPKDTGPAFREAVEKRVSLRIEFTSKKEVVYYVIRRPSTQMGRIHR